MHDPGDEHVDIPNRAKDLHALAENFLKNLVRGSAEFGGWGHDDKRPYGNSVCIEGDILEAAGYELDGELTEDDEDYARSLYNDLGEYLKKCNLVAPRQGVA